MTKILCRNHECIHASVDKTATWASCKKPIVHIIKFQKCSEYTPSEEYLDYIKKGK